LRRICLLQYLTDGEIEGTGRRRRKCRQLLSVVNETRTLEIERGNTRFYCLENSLLKIPRTRRKTDKVTMVLMTNVWEQLRVMNVKCGL
jgi:hypothetical protein